MKFFDKKAKSLIISILMIIVLTTPVYADQINLVPDDNILNDVVKEHIIKEKSKYEDNQEDIYYLGKGVTFYGRNATSERLHTDTLFTDEDDCDFDIESYMPTEFAENEAGKTLETLTKFVDDYLPEKYGNVDIFFTPVRFAGVHGFYATFYSQERRPAISLAATGRQGKSTLFHELGHHVKHIHYDKGRGRFSEYKDLFKDKKLRPNPYGYKWNTLIGESFAEDFSTYVRYSFEGLSMEEANKIKRTIYPFTEEIVEFFDKEFPEIQKQRLRVLGECEEIEKITRGQKALDLASYSNWAEKDIYKFHYNGLTINQNNYTRDLTREQFANMIVQLYEIKTKEEIKYKTAFVDTDKDYVSKAAELGIVKGIGDNKFAPDETIKREHIYLMIDRLSSVLEQEIPIDRSITNRNTSLEEGVAIINRFMK